MQVRVVHHPQVIGEAANNLSPVFIDSHPGIPWQRIIGLRHALVHQYFGVDPDAIWSIAVDDLLRSRRRSPQSSSGPGDTRAGPNGLVRRTAPS